MSTISFAMALLMGFTGSLHCAGMCGPIMLVMPFANIGGGMKKWSGIFLYHLGRTSVYAVMAYILYSFRSFFQPQIQQYISIALGIILLILGLITFLPGSRFSISLPWSGFVRKQISKFIGGPSIFSLFVTGVLNGLLPCGLVYMALAAAITAQSSVQAAMLMYAFGIGTVPMLVSITIVKSKISFLHLKNIKKLVPVTMFVFGSLFVLRGMNLGIPYLSPKLEVTEHVVKANCCHKK